MKPDDRLRAIVIGAGFAGEGHTLALRHSGVEVVAICVRQPAVVRAVATVSRPASLHRLAPYTGDGQAGHCCAGDPSIARGEVVEAAAALGCHLFCDKPLAPAEEARRLHHLVERAGVKHAYASTLRYDPALTWLTNWSATAP